MSQSLLGGIGTNSDGRDEPLGCGSAAAGRSWVAQRWETAGPRAALRDVLVAVPGTGEPLPAHGGGRARELCASEGAGIIRAACPGWQPSRARRKKKLFWSPAHALLLMEQRWVVASPSWRCHRGPLTHISFTNIKGLSKAETMLCHHRPRHDGSICSSAAGAEPQCTITTRCQHQRHLHCPGPQPGTPVFPGTPRLSLPGTATARPSLPPLA